jgi:hypothetical protein
MTRSMFPDLRLVLMLAGSIMMFTGWFSGTASGASARIRTRGQRGQGLYCEQQRDIGLPKSA